MREMMERGRHGGGSHGENAGEANGSSTKLTNEKVREIRSAYRCGELSQVELEQMFGVSQANISQIVNGKIWGHLCD